MKNILSKDQISKTYLSTPFSSSELLALYNWKEIKKVIGNFNARKFPESELTLAAVVKEDHYLYLLFSPRYIHSSYLTKHFTSSEKVLYLSELSEENKVLKLEKELKSSELFIRLGLLLSPHQMLLGELERVNYLLSLEKGENMISEDFSILSFYFDLPSLD